jgi:hypothetical protein
VTTPVRCSLPAGQNWWTWDPETGKASPYPSGPEGFQLKLRPLDSLLLVSGPAHGASPEEELRTVAELNGPWELSFQPIPTQQPFTLRFNNLQSFETHPDPRVNRFSGVVDYRTRFSLPEGGATHLMLGDTREMPVEVILNGTSLGTQWAAQKVFDLRPALRASDNELHLRAHSTLFNGMMGTEPFNRLWNKFNRNQTPELQPSGLLGPVQLLRK